MSEIEERLEQIKARGLYRRLRVISGPQGPRVLLDGKPVLLLCSNNYLGFADHPRVREAAADAAMRYGAGAGASRLVSGNMRVHRLLEQQLADFKRSAACVLFGSGYLVNAGVIPALVRKGEVVFSDELNHASVIDGCRLANAETFVYNHADIEHLAWGLRQAGGRGSLIVTDGIFSMDGDVAPLEEIVELAGAYDTRVMVDEAHATGTLGPDGRGTVAAAGLEGRVDVVVGTLSKSLGSYGAFACCSKTMAKYIVNSARTLIFSTALPPPAVAAAMAALALLREQPRRVDKLQRNAWILREALAEQGLSVELAGTHIVPLVVGEADAAMSACERALKQGVFAQAIRPPTVPEGSSRLRLAVMASHTKSELRDAAKKLSAAVQPLLEQPEQARSRRRLGRDRVATPFRDHGERERAARERAARKAAQAAERPQPAYPAREEAASAEASPAATAAKTAESEPATATAPAKPASEEPTRAQPASPRSTRPPKSGGTGVFDQLADVA